MNVRRVIDREVGPDVRIQPEIAASTASAQTCSSIGRRRIAPIESG
jgi:hypothetical protein